VSVIGLFVSKIILALRLFLAIPSMSPLEAYRHADAASEASTPHVSAELLLAVAWIESRYDPTATSRIEGSVRRTGHYPSTEPPSNLGRGSLYCGPLQTYASTWPACIDMRRLDVAYAAGVSELEQWLRDPRVRGDITLALAGHGCGNQGVAGGPCHDYPARVLAIAEWITRPVVRLRKPVL
jgi:hypothetical protein